MRANFVIKNCCINVRFSTTYRINKSIYNIIKYVNERVLHSLYHTKFILTTFGLDCRRVEPRCDNGTSTSECSTFQFRASRAFKLSLTGSL